MRETLPRWNPWWESGAVPKGKKLMPREAQASPILKLMETKEIISISGVRRCGKSTLMYQVIDALLHKVPAKNILYFNFDEPLPQKNVQTLEEVYRAFLELNNPKGRKYVFLDELQSVEGWEEWLKKYYELYGGDVKFIITGSNSSMLSEGLLKLLTGRMFSQKIFPLSFAEFLFFRGVEPKTEIAHREEMQHYLLDYLNRGGFPETALENDPDINERRLREYFDGILLRDVVAARHVRETAKLAELARYCITNISREASYNQLSRLTGINVNSIREYLSYFEDAYLLFQLKQFSYSLKESIAEQKPRKIYCIDNGLRNAAGFKFSRDEGRLAENLVFLHLRRSGSEIYYWKGKGEVDFIVKNRDDSLSAINVCYSDKITSRETSPLLEFSEKFKKTAALTLITKGTEKNEGKLRFVPLWKWLLFG